MKNKLISLLLALIMLLALSACEKPENNRSAAESQEESTPMKYQSYDFTVWDENGNTVHLSDFIGKPIVINFWATWCGYCKQEMPDFQKASEEYPDVVFLMVNATDGETETVEKASAYIKENKYTFTVVYDKFYDAINAYSVRAFPTTYLIDREGYIVAASSGMLDYESLKKGIEMIR